MKIQGILGKGTGKLGSSVFAVSGGEQIVREYNPNVSNPNTEAQVAQRAKLKLMSQLAAALATAMGFAKQGLVSARNQFVSKNIGLCTFNEGKATAPLAQVQLTPSNAAFPEFADPTMSEGVLSVELASAASADVKRVVYAVYNVNAEGNLVFVGSKIVSEAGEGSLFPTTFNNIAGDIVIYAYGVKDTTSAATIKYENMVANATGEVATLDVIKLFRTAGYDLTKSVGIAWTF